jgi:N-acylglucosamine 2-epimerase
MNTQRRNELIAVYRDGLLKDTLPFWLPRCVDKEHGGFMIARDRDGSLLDTDKGMWQQCRFTWLLATLYNNVEPREEWLAAARHGIEFISKHGFDTDGRMWFHVTREGEPIRKRRYTFTEIFGAIAYAACAKATGDAAMADKARELHTTAQNHFTNPRLPDTKYTKTRPMKSIGAPMMLLATAQELRDCLGGDSFNADIDACIEEIQRDFMKPDLECVMENVGPKGEVLDHFDGRLLNPGHTIEAAWFVLNEARHRGNDAALISRGCQMLDWMWARGWDTEYGGIFYFRDLFNKPVQEYWHDMKFWWVHNEAILATLLAYLLTGDTRYEAMHRQVHDWAYAHFPDAKHGEWYGYLHRDGRVSVPLKGNLWKGPFHLPRMQLYGWQWLAAKSI